MPDITQDWLNRLTELSQTDIKSPNRRCWVAPAQFIFNPLSDRQIVINPRDQFKSAFLQLGEYNELSMSIASVHSPDILNLLAYAWEPGRVCETPKVQSHSCVVRPCCGEDFKPVNDVGCWITLPRVQPLFKHTISIEYSNYNQTTYDLEFKLLPDDQECVAYFGKVGMSAEMSDKQLTLMMGVW
jgi:hypothetical protein